MTSPANVQPYDFRRPRRLADDVEQEFNAWASAVATLMRDRWEQQLGIRARWHSKSTYTATRSELVERVADQYTCFGLQFNETVGAVWVAMSRRLAIGLMAATLGDELTEMPGDRKLTDVEESVMELAWHEFARVATDAQPHTPVLLCDPQGPRRTQELVRAFSEQDPVTVLEFELETDFGTESLLWLFSQDAALQYIGHASECRQRLAGDSPSLDSTVQQISMEMIVRLGGAKLHVADLLNLQPGDVIVLDQRVSEPLAVEVCKSVMFRGWPGRIGTRQALQVSELVDESDR
jgi:flagellar motor switch protein FliM